MFQKNTSLPARPPIPSREEIMDDLAHASPNDVFHLEAEKVLEFPGADYTDDLPEIGKDGESNEISECKNPHQSYVKVASFVEKSNSLEKYLAEVEKKKSNLKILEETLLADIAKVEEELKKRSET
ncbi:hypothetical protein CDAR_566631 [Caerostris darwini]|uniref:Uncharacterized protein n=1 Tax=Caerostris darwini TaxID=1538125 RepID=A0AAV4X514_9ARAC|nr:hypothetical protein CDAR_566631 [Caerostris darwini]